MVHLSSHKCAEPDGGAHLLARGVTGFLARNQEYELAALQVTGEDGREVLGRMLTAPKQLRAATMECAAKKRTRDALERTLRRKMRQVVVILGVTIRAQDGRWLAFGLNRPARSAGVRRPSYRRASRVR